MEEVIGTIVLILGTVFVFSLIYNFFATYPIILGIVIVFIIGGGIIAVTYFKAKADKQEEYKKEVSEKINSPVVMDLIKKFIAQYINENEFLLPRIFFDEDVKILNTIIKDEVGYVIDEKFLLETLQYISTKMFYNAFDKRFCEVNPNLGAKLSEWIEAYVNTFEENMRFIDLFGVKLEKLRIDPTIGIKKEEIVDAYCLFMEQDTIDNADLKIIERIYTKEDEDSNNFFIYAHIQKEIEERRIKRLAQEHKENMAGGRKIRKNKIDINFVDSMEGIEFENFLVGLFSKRNYKAEITQASNDQGADLIIEKLGVRTAVQAKCYSSTVGNSSVQEVTGAKQIYNCTKAMVVTNNYFTKSAIELAIANNVELIDRDSLISWLEAYPIFLEDFAIVK